jgi:hypothetical protein
MEAHDSLGPQALAALPDPAKHDGEEALSMSLRTGGIQQS